MLTIFLYRNTPIQFFQKHILNNCYRLDFFATFDKKNGS